MDRTVWDARGPGGVVKNLAGLITWVGSSMVGLSAILYGAGFLVVHAHLSLLGVSGTSVPVIEYLKEGARFALMNVMMIYWDNAIFLLVLGVVAISVITRFVVRPEATRNDSPASSRSHILPEWVRRLLSGRVLTLSSAYGRWTLVVLTLAATALCLSTLPSFFIAVSINDLLLRSDSLSVEVPEPLSQGGEAFPLPAGLAGGEASVKEVVISEIKSADESPRYRRYQRLLFSYLLVLALVWSISKIMSGTSAHPHSRQSKRQELILQVSLFGAAAVASIELLLLPVNFGKLIVSNEFPVVLVTVGNDALAQQVPADRLFLMLAKNDEELILYDPDNPIWDSIVMLKRSHASGIRVVGTDRAL